MSSILPGIVAKTSSFGQIVAEAIKEPACRSLTRSSAAAELAALLPGAKVVKAFNSNFAATLASGELGGEPTVVQIAGDDDAAKKLLADVVTAAGLKVADAGSLKRARELEALGFLQMVLAVREQIGWTGGFAVRV